MALDGLLDKLHTAALATGVFPLGGLRIRAHRADHYRIADNAPDNGFVHVTAIIGHGRPLDVQQRAGEELFAVLNFKKNNLHEYVRKRGTAGKAADA